MIVTPVRARKPHSPSVFPIAGLVSGTGTHSIASSPNTISRSSTIFGRCGVIVVSTREAVDLSRTVEMLDDGDTAAARRNEAVLDANTGQACLDEVVHVGCSSLSLEAGNRRRPRRFDSFISTIPISADASV